MLFNSANCASAGKTRGSSCFTLKSFLFVYGHGGYTCGQHMAHVIQYNPFNNCRITIRLKTCQCVRVSQRTNHARGAILQRSPGVAFPPSYEVSRAWARVFYALLCLSHDYSRSTKFWVKICVLFLSICSDLSLHFNFLYVEEGLRQTSRFSYLRRTHGS